MDRYEFKVRGTNDKLVKLFLSTEEVKTLCMESLLYRILTRFSGLRGSLRSWRCGEINFWRRDGIVGAREIKFWPPEASGETARNTPCQRTWVF